MVRSRGPSKNRAFLYSLNYGEEKAFFQYNLTRTHAID